MFELYSGKFLGNTTHASSWNACKVLSKKKFGLQTELNMKIIAFVVCSWKESYALCH